METQGQVLSPIAEIGVGGKGTPRAPTLSNAAAPLTRPAATLSLGGESGKTAPYGARLPAGKSTAFLLPAHDGTLASHRISCYSEASWRMFCAAAGRSLGGVRRPRSPCPVAAHLILLLTGGTRVKIEIEREKDGRWIAEVPDLPGVMVYAKTRSRALAKAQALALRVIADRLDHGESIPDLRELFAVSA